MFKRHEKQTLHLLQRVLSKEQGANLQGCPILCMRGAWSGVSCQFIYTNWNPCGPLLKKSAQGLVSPKSYLLSWGKWFPPAKKSELWPPQKQWDIGNGVDGYDRGEQSD